MVSAVIVVERQEEGQALPVQRPVYYISEVLSETKTRYPQIQKLLYAVVLARRKLRHYFEAHPVTVVSSFPLGEIARNREAEGRIAKWSVELMGETLTYAPARQSSPKSWPTSWLNGRTFSYPITNPGRMLDYVLRQVGNENWCRCRPPLHLASRRTHAVRDPLAFPCFEQYGGV